jgi:L-threonylcarbamoyladenylate synthase
VRILQVDAPSAVDSAVDVVVAGGLLVVPTDTVYGLAARPGDEAALSRIFSAKARPVDRHIPVLAACLDQVRSLGVRFGTTAEELARRYWPGALTIAFGFDRDSARPDWLRGRSEVAVRVPDVDFLRNVMRRTGVLLVTSANAHGAPTRAEAVEAARSLAVEVDLVVDAGMLAGTPSTLVNLNSTPARVERPGPLPADELRGLGIEVPAPSEVPGRPEVPGIPGVPDRPDSSSRPAG